MRLGTTNQRLWGTFSHSCIVLWKRFCTHKHVSKSQVVRVSYLYTSSGAALEGLQHGNSLPCVVVRHVGVCYSHAACPEHGSSSGCKTSSSERHRARFLCGGNISLASHDQKYAQQCSCSAVYTCRNLHLRKGLLEVELQTTARGNSSCKNARHVQVHVRVMCLVSVRRMFVCHVISRSIRKDTQRKEPRAGCWPENFTFTGRVSGQDRVLYIDVAVCL
jgi:hypothetical protein